MPDLTAPMEDDRNWLLVMAALTAIELIWWMIEWGVGAAPAPLIATYGVLATGGLALGAALRFASGMRPSDADWPGVALGTALVAVGASVFLPLKYAIPSEVPFWLDHRLAIAERAIFSGDPWLFLDRVLGWAAVPMDWLYGCWLPVQLSVMFMVMLSNPSSAKSRSLIAYSLAWFLLGVVAAVLLSSAGPLFYDRAFGGHGFARLAEMLRNRGALVAIAESDRMWASMASARPGLVAGISAMPSIHVAVSLWIFLTARTIAPRCRAPALLYFVLVWIGSVQLGWHYASDGLVGAAGMLAVWKMAGALEGWLGNRRRGRRAALALPQPA